MTQTILLTVLAGQFAAAALLPALLWQKFWTDALRLSSLDTPAGSAPAAKNPPAARRRDARNRVDAQGRDRAASARRRTNPKRAAADPRRAAPGRGARA